MYAHNNIPKHWQIKKLGEYVISVKGKKPKHVSKVKTKECSIPYVNIKAFEKNVIDEYTDGIGCVLCEEDDFLIVWDGSRSGFVGKAIKGALGSTLVKLNFPEINNDYAYYFLQSKFFELNKRAKGVGIPHVDPNLLWNYEFPEPPLPEQLAIVSKIEELFSELDKGIESLKTAQQQLKVYRQALLKFAFEGKLTEKWRQQQNEMGACLPAGRFEGKLTKSEFRSQKSELAMAAEVEEKYGNNDLPEGWERVQIKEVVDINPKLPNKENIDKHLEVQFLPMRLVEEVINIIHLTEIKKYESLLKGSYTPFINGDVIFAKVTPCMENGKIAIVNNLKNGIGFGSSEFHVLRCSSKILSNFIFYFVVQDKFRKEAENAMTGAVGLRRVPKQFIENYIIPLPPINDQQIIVEELESRLTVCDKIEETINNGLQQSEALRKSILKQAFEGRLLAKKGK